MKRIALLLGVLVIVIVGAVLVVPGFIDWNGYKSQIQSQIKSATGYDVSLNGNIALSIIPKPALLIESVELRNNGVQLASLGRLDVQIDPEALLSGQIAVSSIDLVKPEIFISFNSDGQLNWSSLDVSENDSSSSNALLDAISLHHIAIKDGTLSYQDGSKGSKPIKASSIALNVVADTLKGPFKLDGTFQYADLPFNLNLGIGQMPQGQSSLPVNLKLTQKDFDVSYSGAVSFGQAFEAQGELAFDARNITPVLDIFDVQPLNLKESSASIAGLLSVSPFEILLRDGDFSLSEQEFSGDVSLRMSPFDIRARLSAAEGFDVGALIPQSSKAKQPVTALAQLMPEKVPLPKGFGTNVSVKLPKAFYNGASVGNIDLALSTEDGHLLANLTLQDTPGGGSAAFVADFDAQEPNLVVTGKARASDAKGFIDTFVSSPNTFVKQKQSISLELQADIKPGTIGLSKSTVKLGQEQYGIIGSIDPKELLLNVKAYGGDIKFHTAPTADKFFNDAAIQLKHPSLALALARINGSEERNDSLEKPIDFYAKVDQLESKTALSDIKFKFGDLPLTGFLTHDLGSGKSSISGAFKADDLEFGPKMRSGRKASDVVRVSAGQSTQNKRKWSKDLIDTAWMNIADVDFTLEADSLYYAPWSLTKPKVKFLLKGGVLTIETLEAGLYEGQISGSGTAKLVDNAALSVETELSVKDIELESLIQSLVGRRLFSGSGKMGMTASLSTTGTSQQELISALSGNGTVNGGAITLQGFDLNRFAKALSDEVKAGDTLLGVWKTASKGGSTVFDTLDGVFGIEKGIVTFEKLALDSETLGMNTTGSVDLPKWYLDTDFDITLKENQDIPPFTMEIEGPLDNPAQTFAEGALQDYLTRKLNRKLEKMLTKKLGGNEALGKALGGAFGQILGVQSSMGKAAEGTSELKQKQLEEQRKKLEEAGEDPDSIPSESTGITPQETFNHLLEGLVE